MHHGIILDLQFHDPKYPEIYNIFAKRPSTSNPWMLYGIEVNSEDLEKTIANVQDNMKADKPYYAHFYNNDDLVVIFKDKIFKVKPHMSTWGPIIEHGRMLKIPEEQLDFWPNRFQDEIHYFKKEHFIK